MTVDQLREALAPMPGHIPVHLAFPMDGSGGGADTEFWYTLECRIENFPSQGRMAVIYPNPEPR